MINFYQPFSRYFFKLSKTKTPPHIGVKYFLSFEDALWQLPVKSILLPDFYCMDVVKNMHLHGKVPIFYPLDDNFQISYRKLLSYIKKYNPDCVIVFHACGIFSNVVKKLRKRNDSPRHTLIIEDCVQRLISPSLLPKLPENYLILDSPRKVSPIPGSFMYYNVSFSPRLVSNISLGLFYKFIIISLYLCFRFLFDLFSYIQWSKGVEVAFKVLYMHDEIVGDSKRGYEGLSIFKHLYSYINFKKIEDKKRTQIKLYKKLFSKICATKKDLCQISVPRSSESYMHVYPLRLKKFDQKLEKFLHERGAIVWHKFTDSPWSQHRSVLFLPLGFHVKDQEIEKLKSWILEYSKLY